MCIFFVLNVEEHQKCFLKTRAVRNSCSRGNIDRSKNVLAETDMIYVYILRNKTWKNTRNALLKRVRFAILAREEISIAARMCWRKQTWYMCIFFALNVEEHQKCFLKTRAVRNSCSRGNIDRRKNVLAEVRISCLKGNIDPNKNVLAETDMIYVFRKQS